MSLVSQTTLRASHWGITVNNPTEDDFVRIRTEQRWLRMVRYQQEKGEKGTPHIQGYANTDQVRMSQMKQWLPKAHFTVLTTKDHIENMKAYVWKKDGTEIPDTQEQIMFRENDNAKPLTMAGAMMEIAKLAWSQGRIERAKNPVQESEPSPGNILVIPCKPRKEKEVFEEEYWSIVKELLIHDPDLVGLYTQPQYMRAWINTRSVWILQHQVDSQTRLSVLTPDGEISPVSV